MKARLCTARVAAVSLVCLLTSVAAFAQTDTGTIAGVTKDSSGLALPGVSVEAASPALIERVRTVVTDGQGQYKIVALPPGVYSVTFSLAGFNSIKRSAVELTTNFTANVNADLQVETFKRRSQCRRPLRSWTCRTSASSARSPRTLSPPFLPEGPTKPSRCSSLELW
jgi:carboxypeptidase family protein